MGLVQTVYKPHDQPGKDHVRYAFCYYRAFLVDVPSLSMENGPPAGKNLRPSGRLAGHFDDSLVHTIRHYSLWLLSLLELVLYHDSYHPDVCFNTTLASMVSGNPDWIVRRGNGVSNISCFPL